MEEATDTVPNPAPKRSLLQNVKRIAGITAAVVALLGAVYLGGYLHGRIAIDHLREQHAAELAAVQTQRDALTRSLDGANRQVQALAARRNLDQAVSALDARNFGIAEQRIKAAAEDLRRSALDERMAALIPPLAAFHLVATEDLGPQRKQIVDWLTQLDALIVVPESR
ncbi:MAG TPA: hypothetical protein VIV60_03705 [Polyangiaceae bacterium]